MLRAHHLHSAVGARIAGRTAGCSSAAALNALRSTSSVSRRGCGASALSLQRPLRPAPSRVAAQTHSAAWHRTLATRDQQADSRSGQTTAGDARPQTQQAPQSQQQQHSTAHPLLPSLRRWWLQRSRRNLPSAPLPCAAAAVAGTSTAAEAASSTDATGSDAAAAADGALDVQATVTQQLAEQLAAAGGDAAGAAASAVSGPIHPLLQAAMDSIVWVHEVSGTPWWASLVLCGLAARIMLLPVQLYSGRVAAGMAGLEPHFIQLDVLARSSPHPPFTRFLVLAKLKWTLYNKYRCNPLLLVPGGVLQMSTFVLMAMSLRKLITTNPDLAVGGALWFPNLAIPDPTFALPVATWVAGYAVSTYIGWQREREGAALREKAVATVVAKKHAKEQTKAIAMQKGEGPVPADTAAAAAAVAAPAPPKREPTHLELLGHYGRGLQILMITVLPQLPAGLMFFWLTSISWQLGSHLLLKVPAVRARLGYTAAEEVLRNKTAEMALERSRTADQQMEAAKAAANAAAAGSKRLGQNGPATPYVQQPGAMRRVSSLPVSNPVPAKAASEQPLSKRKQKQLEWAGRAPPSQQPKPAKPAAAAAAVAPSSATAAASKSPR